LNDEQARTDHEPSYQDHYLGWQAELVHEPSFDTGRIG
jgi:hypothetical protein